MGKPAALYEALHDGVTVTTRDGFPLSADRFHPLASGGAQPLPRAIVVIANATGLAARFYHDFASWLASQGVEAWTFDYRFSGRSFPADVLGKLDEATARIAQAGEKGDDEAKEEAEDSYAEAFEDGLLMSPEDIGLTTTWAREDLDAIVQAACANARNEAPLTLLGNSLGGHLISYLEPSRLQSLGRTVRHLDVCGGNAHWRNQNTPLPARFAMEELVGRPLEEERVFRCTAMGLGYDLPLGPGREWLEWFRHPCFSARMRSDELRAKENAKKHEYLYVGFEDDETITKIMMEKHVAQLCGPSSLTRSLWIDPLRNRPSWPTCGHVNSFSPTRPSSDGEPQSGGKVDGDGDAREANRRADNEKGRGAELYEPAHRSSYDAAQTSPIPQAHTSDRAELTREETIFSLYLCYILHGHDGLPSSVGEMREWGATDAVDCEAMRREEEVTREREKTEGDGMRELAQSEEQEGESEAQFKAKL